MMGMDTNRIEELKQAVQAGGGEWIGIQEGFEPPALVMFKNPTNGLQLGIFDDLLTVERIQDKIARSNRAFMSSPVKILSREKYNRLMNHLQEIVNILSEEKK